MRIEAHQSCRSGCRSKDADGSARVKPALSDEMIRIDGLGNLHLNLETGNEGGQEVSARGFGSFRNRVACARRLYREMNQDGSIGFPRQGGIVPVMRVSCRAIDQRGHLHRNADAARAQGRSFAVSSAVPGILAQDFRARLRGAREDRRGTVDDATLCNPDSLGRDIFEIELRDEFSELLGDCPVNRLPCP